MSRVEGTSVTTQRRGMSKGRSKGGGKRAMQQGTRRSPWRPRVFPSHAARDKACEHQASWLRTRDERHGERRGFVNHGALICAERHGERRGFVNHGALICAERHRERRGFVNHGALICDRCGSWRKRPMSLSYYSAVSYSRTGSGTPSIQVEFGSVCYVVRMWLTCGYL